MRQIGPFTTALTVSIFGVLAVAGIRPSLASAQGQHSHAPTAQAPQQPGELVGVVREATARFADVAVAESEGYALQFGCVSGPDSGAMGLHYVNGPLVMDGELDAARPEIVIYEPTANGRPRMIGADYLVLAEAWHAKHEGQPQIMGQLLHYFEAPNRFGLPPFYTLHVWAWKENPTGMFVNWHSDVSCNAFSGQQNP
jgi:hypothetical protein